MNLAAALWFNISAAVLVILCVFVALGWRAYGKRKKKGTGLGRGLSKKEMKELAQLRSFNGNGKHKKTGS